MDSTLNKPTKSDTTSPSPPMWEFWIDVGGTFTDCIGKAPDSTLHHCKVLSSGIFKGRVGTGSTSTRILDAAKSDFPEDFFADFEIRILDTNSESLDSAQVTSFDPDGGVFELDREVAITGNKPDSFELSSGEPAPVIGIRQILGLKLRDPIHNVRILLGTTLGTNALLERKGSKVAYVTTRGFADLLKIGTQARPELFKLNCPKPKMLYDRVFEIAERIDSSGRVIAPLSATEIDRLIGELRAGDSDSVAVCLINAYANPVHEQRLAAAIRSSGVIGVSVSTKLSPTIKALDRGDTTVVDAYLSPIIQAYVNEIRRLCCTATNNDTSTIEFSPLVGLKLMTSAGGLVDADAFSGKDSILSGPAGGVTGFAHAIKAAGFSKAIGFDMGGTSTDVSRFDGEFEYDFATEIANARIVAPLLSIETIAAGGGSICKFDGHRLQVGPHSAGADPGPACYGKNGPLTITDVNLFAGKIDPDHFPFPLNREVVSHRLEAIARSIEVSGGPVYTPAEVAGGFTRIANEKMAAAIKRISTAKGYDPREYVLAAFGGAAAQHSCAIARLLGIRSIIISPWAGVMSAFGIGAADYKRFAEKTVLAPLGDAGLREIEPILSEMASRLRTELMVEGIPSHRIQAPHRMLDLRYVGEESTITVHESSTSDYRIEFEAMHQQLYGHLHAGREIEIVTVRIEIIGETENPEVTSSPLQERSISPNHSVECLFDAKLVSTDVYKRERLVPGDLIAGPAIILEEYTTIVIDPAWSARVTAENNIVITDKNPVAESIQSATECDPIRLELFENRFTHIAIGMGVILQKTALSVNIKERLDFSCAILDGTGDLIVNAPHIPVHLGAMSAAVKSLISNADEALSDSIRSEDIRPGDVYLSNDPDLGGSHLPDLTVITPVFSDDGKEIRFFTASRAHHAEIGGVRPGSCFPFAKNLAEEGVVFSNLLIMRNEEFLADDVMRILQDGPYPSRSPAENIADIKAAIAANRAGLRELNTLITKESWPTVRAYMNFLRRAAEDKTRSAILALEDGDYSFEDCLDDGSPIKVSIRIESDEMTIDFTGTGPVNETCFNANPAIVQSAVLYCLRTIVNDDIALNSGVLAPITLVLQEGMLNPPVEPDPKRHPPVVAGNVEVSQRIVDVILGALGIAAASQGTMNNIVFGNESFGYYETICGGNGGTQELDGADAMHSHMTNTRITDVEVLERNFPVRINRFEIRRDSGGNGARPGGDGVVREFEFCAPLEVSLLTQRRTTAPFGSAGGEPGNPGENILKRIDSQSPEALSSLAQFTAQPGDKLTIKTPGGGGYGRNASGFQGAEEKQRLKN